MIYFQAGKCAYAILLMAVYWMTEVLPIAVTALFPVCFMPWFGIIPCEKAIMNYLKDTNMLFFGGEIFFISEFERSWCRGQY